eukprot:9456565-Pyramimonas_sp.AAC.1
MRRRNQKTAPARARSPHADQPRTNRQLAAKGGGAEELKQRPASASAPGQTRLLGVPAQGGLHSLVEQSALCRGKGG